MAAYSSRVYERHVLAADSALHSQIKDGLWRQSTYMVRVESSSNPVVDILTLHITITVMAHGNKEAPYR